MYCLQYAQAAKSVCLSTCNFSQLAPPPLPPISRKAPRTHPIGIENSSISPRCVGHRHRLIHRLRETNTLTHTHTRHAHAHLPVAVAGVSLALLHVALQLVKHVSKYTYYYLGSTATSCPCYTPWSSGCLLACSHACINKPAMGVDCCCLPAYPRGVSYTPTYIYKHTVINLASEQSKPQSSKSPPPHSNSSCKT